MTEPHELEKVIASQCQQIIKDVGAAAQTTSDAGRLLVEMAESLRESLPGIVERDTLIANLLFSAGAFSSATTVIMSTVEKMAKGLEMIDFSEFAKAAVRREQRDARAEKN